MKFPQRFVIISRNFLEIKRRKYFLCRNHKIYSFEVRNTQLIYIYRKPLSLCKTKTAKPKKTRIFRPDHTLNNDDRSAKNLRNSQMLGKIYM